MKPKTWIIILTSMLLVVALFILYKMYERIELMEQEYKYRLELRDNIIRQQAKNYNNLDSIYQSWQEQYYEK